MLMKAEQVMQMPRHRGPVVRQRSQGSYSSLYVLPRRKKKGNVATDFISSNKIWKEKKSPIFLYEFSQFLKYWTDIWIFILVHITW